MNPSLFPEMEAEEAVREARKKAFAALEALEDKVTSRDFAVVSEDSQSDELAKRCEALEEENARLRELNRHVSEGLDGVMRKMRALQPTASEEDAEDISEDDGDGA